MSQPRLRKPQFLCSLREMAEDKAAGWKFHQVFGDKGFVEEIAEADIITAVEFDHTGDFLATGDKGGRIVLFERDQKGKELLYNFYTEFQSHEPEFDYLKSLEIEEKINQIKWLKRQNSARFLLSTNDKTIKLWKIYEKQLNTISNMNLAENGADEEATSLRVPQLTHQETVCAAVPRRVFANAHAYHINSVSLNSDDETYLSADDLRINLWNTAISKESFNIVDMKPDNMEELTEVITAAEFHPKSCNMFVYSTSKGTLKLCDMRDAALCDQHSKMFEEKEDPSNKSFFSEIIASVSDVRFSNDGRYVLSRDYMSLKIWDLAMESKPVKTFTVHDHLRTKLCDLYESDCIFDKFGATWSGNDQYLMTGSYHNMFRIFDQKGQSDVWMEASKVPSKGGGSFMKSFGSSKKKLEPNVAAIDFNRKALYTAWHPTTDLVAVAATNNLFLFSRP